MPGMLAGRHLSAGRNHRAVAATAIAGCGTAFVVWRAARCKMQAPASAVRRLITPRDDLRPAYLNTQGMRVGKSGEVLQVREKEALKQEIRIGEICQLNLMGNIQVSTQAIQSLC